MNPITNAKNQQKLTERELELGLTNKKSWHDQYKDSAWIFVGGLPYDLTEGDVICVFSQYGEIVNINLVRDNKTGKSKGFCFICYEDQRSTVLTVDNLNGIKLLGRILRVDHVEEYRKPKEHGDEDEATLKLRTEGCAPRIQDSPEQQQQSEEEEDPLTMMKKEKKLKKEKKEKKKKKKKKKMKESSTESESSSDEGTNRKSSRSKSINTDFRVKKEKHDPGYDRALNNSWDGPTAGTSSSKRSRSPDNGYSRQQKFSKSARDDSRNRQSYQNDTRDDSSSYRDRDDFRDKNDKRNDRSSYDRDYRKDQRFDDRQRFENRHGDRDNQNSFRDDRNIEDRESRRSGGYRNERSYGVNERRSDSGMGSFDRRGRNWDNRNCKEINRRNERDEDGDDRRRDNRDYARSRDKDNRR